MILAGSLFALKMAYVLCTALALPITQGALFVSTTKTRIAAFMDAVPMKTGQMLMDLGCGDGRVLRQAYKNYGVRAVGFEVKYTDAPRTSKSMRHALSDLSLDRLYVVYPGRHSFQLDERIMALSILELHQMLR